VNFNCDEIQKDLRDFSKKVPPENNINEIMEAMNFSKMSEFSESLKKLLPDNLMKVEDNGKISLLKGKLKESVFSENTENIKKIIEDEVNGVVEGLKGNFKMNKVVSSVYDDLNQIQSVIDENSNIASNLAISSLNEAKKINTDVQNLAYMMNASKKTIDSFTNLSPKKIRDLQNNPDFENALKKAASEMALNKIKLESELIANESLINQQLDNSSYIELFNRSISNNLSSEDFTLKIFVERTVYWGNGDGAILDSYSKKTSTGFKLINNYSLAVDNSNILLGCKITFSDEIEKEREAVDVLNQSKGITKSGRNPVVAIFFDNKKDAVEYIEKYPSKIVEATIKFSISETNKDKNIKKGSLENIKKRIEEEDENILNLKRKLGII
jgi:hypothetical protein